MNWSDQRKANTERLTQLARIGVTVDLTPHLIAFLVDYLYPVRHPDYDDLHERWEAIVAAIIDQAEQNVRQIRLSAPNALNGLQKGRWE